MKSATIRESQRLFALAAAALALALTAMLSLGAAQASAAGLAAGSAQQARAATQATELRTSAAKPKPSKVLSMSFKSGLLTVRWQKVPGVDGYELVYSQDGAFEFDSRAVKRVEVTKKRSTYDAFTKCAFRERTALNGNVLRATIRTFKIVDGKRVYSPWPASREYVARTTWNKTLVAPKQCDGYSYGTFGDYLEGAVVILKNGNPKVAKMYGDGELRVCRPGKATIVYKYQGKKITLKVNVVKWTAPFKTFQVGSKNITKFVNQWNSSIPNGGADGVAGGKLSGKLNIKPADNWKISSIKVERPRGPMKKVSNGYKMTQSDEGLTVNLVNKKTKAVASMFIANMRDEGGGWF